jgi:hypothetical protein
MGVALVAAITLGAGPALAAGYSGTAGSFDPLALRTAG